jgi:hypothetical protein
MSDAEAMMAEHNRKMALLAEKYIGKQEMERGLAMPDLWFKKQWYCNRIKELGVQAGRTNMRQRKCKYGSAKWQYYETIEQELLLLADNLAIELVAL